MREFGFYRMKSFGDVWQKAKELTNAKVNPVVALQWISTLEPVRLEDDVAYFSCTSTFAKEIIEKRYVHEIADSLMTVLGFEVDVVVFVQEDTLEEERATDEHITHVLKSKSPMGTDNISKWQLEPRYTFDNFVVGSGNQFAHAAALAVAARPAETWNPLFIYGNSGLGKTHLMYAIGNAVKKKFPHYNVVYVKSEDFTNELIRAMQVGADGEGGTLAFKNKYRNADILLIDDIQFIGGKTQTQEEFFHTFVTLYGAGKQIVMTSDRPPKEISTLEERLLTRFESGLMADVQAPDYEMRCAIIRKKADSTSVKLSPDVVDYLAVTLKDNVRQIEGAVMKLRAHHLLSGRVINRELAAEIVRDMASENEPIVKKLDRIINDVSHFYGVSVEDLTGQKRTAKIANARKVAMYVIREATELSYPLIGEKFSGRNHTTVMYSVKEVDEEIKTNYQLKNEINDFLKNLRS